MYYFLPTLRWPRWLNVLAVLLVVAASHLIANTSYAMTNPFSSLPRNMRLKAFDPYRTSFTCVYEADKVPPIDPQAQQWFEQALEMTGGRRWPRDYDYPGALKLYEQAAERKHWKAMINLANAYMQGLGTRQDPEKAVQLIEQAMELGIPAAFDVMGTWHMYGKGVRQNATRAYAFWQLAADMGNPDSQTYLATHTNGTIDNPKQAQWANRPIALQMMACAYAQGNGNAAYEYGVNLDVQDEYAKALQVLHDGVKFGSDECADYLDSSFRNGDALVGHIVDEARGRRYSTLGDALRRNRELRFPNLDKVLPLPPAELPVWDGEFKSLVNAAKAIAPVAPPSAQSQSTGRAHIPEGHHLVQGQRTMQVDGFPVPWQLPSAGTVPQAGYWQPMLGDRVLEQPLRYALGEVLPSASSWSQLSVDDRYSTRLLWHYRGQALPDGSLRSHREQAGWVIGVQVDLSHPLHCAAGQPCPRSGIWVVEPRTFNAAVQALDERLAQTYVEQGQTMLHPQQGRLDHTPEHLRLTAADFEWLWLGFANTREADQQLHINVPTSAS